MGNPYIHAPSHLPGGSDPIAAPDPPNWTTLTGKPSSFTPSLHASTHAAGGTDPVSFSAPAPFVYTNTVTANTTVDCSNATNIIINITLGSIGSGLMTLFLTNVAVGVPMQIVFFNSSGLSISVSISLKDINAASCSPVCYLSGGSFLPMGSGRSLATTKAFCYMGSLNTLAGSAIFLAI